MAEESDLEKTEQASARRLEKAREEGDVPRSRELATFAVLLAAALGFWLSGEAIVRQLQHMLVTGLAFRLERVLDPAGFAAQWQAQLLDLLLAFAPLAGLMLLAALGSPLLIGGWVFSGKALGPDFGKLNPMRGLGNMVSLRALSELLKALAKTGLVAAVAWLVMSTQTPALMSLASQAPASGAAQQGRLLLLCFSMLLAALAAIALVDAPYQMWQYASKLKMTRQDLRDEAKEAEGNPEIKAKLRAQQREMARRRMMAQVPSADVVVTNPTHYAVALKYAQDGAHAPRVVAKGVGEIAARIRELAAANDVLLTLTYPTRAGRTRASSHQRRRYAAHGARSRGGCLVHRRFWRLPDRGQMADPRTAQHRRRSAEPSRGVDAQYGAAREPDVGFRADATARPG